MPSATPFIPIHSNTDNMKPAELKTSFRIMIDDQCQGVGAYQPGSLTDGKPVLFLNMEALISAFKDDPEPERTADLRDSLLSTITHEFCHAMQEWLEKEFDEGEVERILGAYNEKWNAVEGAEQTLMDDEGPAFYLYHLFDYLDMDTAETAAELKQNIKRDFAGWNNWYKERQKLLEQKGLHPNAEMKAYLDNQQQ